LLASSASEPISVEHQVELAHVGPVLRSRNGVGDLQVLNDLFHGRHIAAAHGFFQTGVDLIDLFLIFLYAGIGADEHGPVKILKPLRRLLHFLLDLLLQLLDISFDQLVRAVTLLRVTVVDHRIIKGIHVARGLPGRGMHKDRRVDTHNVIVQQCHELPPILLNVILQLRTVLPIVINSAQTIIDLAGWKNKAVLLRVGDDILKKVVFLISHRPANIALGPSTAILVMFK